MSSSLTQFNDTNFDDQVMQSDKPVLVDFGAEWCPPCKALAPIIEELAEEYGERALIGAVDADVSPRTASRFQVSGLPTIIIFKNGQIVDRMMGLQQKRKLVAALDKALAAPAT